MSKTHYLKTWPEFFRFVADGTKPFEVREDDGRGFAEGDTLVLLEWEPAAVVEDDRDGYTGRWLERRVTYVLRGPGFGVEASHVVMGLEHPQLMYSPFFKIVREAIRLRRAGPATALFIAVDELPAMLRSAFEGRFRDDE